MENRISTISGLEQNVSAILESYRKKVYAYVEEEMWKAFEEVGRCVQQYQKPSLDENDEDVSAQKARDYLHLMSKGGICGLSYATVRDICRTIEAGEAISEKAQDKKNTYLVEFLRTRTLSFEATRSKYPNYLKAWTAEDDQKLERMWCEGASVKKLASTFGRNPGAIKARIEKLELEEKYG